MVPFCCAMDHELTTNTMIALTSAFKLDSALIICSENTEWSLLLQVFGFRRGALFAICAIIKKRKASVVPGRDPGLAPPFPTINLVFAAFVEFHRARTLPNYDPRLQEMFVPIDWGSQRDPRFSSLSMKSDR